MTQDIRVALRTLLGAPLTSLAAIVVIGLGIGANTAVGAVLPAAFAFPEEGVDVWRRERPSEIDPTKSFRIVARLAPEVTLSAFTADAGRVQREVREWDGKEWRGGWPMVTPLREAATGGMQPVLRVALAGAFLVLLVTCGNVAMLLLGRAVLALFGRSVAEQRRELAIRRALGASGRRLTVWVLHRALGLTALGLLAGAVGSLLASEALRSLLFGVSPQDPATLLGVATLVTLAALPAAWIPARRAARVEPWELLRED